MTEQKTRSQTLSEERNREQVAPHERHIDVQTLDALLRIEELLLSLIKVMTPPVITVDESSKTIVEAGGLIDQKPSGIINAKKAPKGVTRL